MKNLLFTLSFFTTLFLMSCGIGDDTQMFDVKISVSPTEVGSISPSTDSTYEEGQTISLRADAVESYAFSNWTGDIDTTDNPLSLTIDQNYTLTANFEKKSYELTVITEGEGSVSEEIIQEKPKDYEHGAVVELTANPSDGWQFEEWKGNIIGDENPVQIKIDEPKKVTAVFSNSAFADGNGTESSPYKVSTIEQLQSVYDYPDANFVQISDIDASETSNWNNGKGFIPIGDDVIKFTGSYNGEEYKIINLTIDRDENYVGLFGFVENGVIKNVALENVNIRGNDYTGGLVGNFYGFEESEILNSYVKGSVSGSSQVGGLVGENTAKIVMSYASCEVSGNGYSDAGGLIGKNMGSFNIDDSYASGDVSGKRYVGGLVGRDNRSANMDNSYAEGNVSGDTFVGGLVGLHSQGNIQNSHATGDISGNENIGGLIGRTRATVKNSFATGNVSGGNRIGGLVGWSRKQAMGEIQYSYAVGDVSGSNQVGGLVGENTEENIIRGSYALGNIQGEIEVGGLVGRNSDQAVITASYSKGEVIGDEDFGGLVGLNGAKIDSSYWDTESTNQTNGVGRGSSDGTTGLTTSEMTGSSAEDNMSDFDFINIWVTADSYPILFWEKNN